MRVEGQNLIRWELFEECRIGDGEVVNRGPEKLLLKVGHRIPRPKSSLHHVSVAGFRV